VITEPPFEVSVQPTVIVPDFYEIKMGALLIAGALASIKVDLNEKVPYPASVLTLILY
jgi:hypothetical protein